MIKQGLNIGLGQSLTMTPQLQQAIKLLQLSSIELEQEIQNELESNPLLEVSEERNELESKENTPDDTSTQEKNTEQTITQDIPSEMDIDANWEDIYSDHSSNQASSDSDSTTTILEKTYTLSKSLQEHLRHQLELSHLSSVDRAIAEMIVDSVDSKGYLTISAQALYEQLKDELLLEDIDEVESTLAYVQHLDPLGVAARSPGECLAIQLMSKYPDKPLAVKSAIAIKKNPSLLEIKHHPKLKRNLKLSAAKFSELISLIKTLNPYPGSGFESDNVEYITPDVYVKKIGGCWQVSLSPSISPKLQVNDFYADLLMTKGETSDLKYLKSNLQQANWFIKSIQSRNHTILKVTTLIVKHQKAFLQYGEQAMKPLILHDIAEQLDMHDSSISRATTRKYVHTPRGIFELKYFFSSQISSDTGGSCSSTAIQSMIKKFIHNEDLKKPLSDSKLMILLEKQDIKVARRTVAKYREALNIPASHERKIMA